MRTRTFVATLFAAALIAAPAAGLAGQGQGQRQGADRQAPQHRAQAERGQRDMGADRMRLHDRAGTADQDRIHDQDRVRDQDRIHAPVGTQQDANNIYGYKLMSEDERNAYQERIRKAGSQLEREQIEAQHRHEMQVRAAAKGVTIEEPARNRPGRDDG